MGEDHPDSLDRRVLDLLRPVPEEITTSQVQEAVRACGAILDDLALARLTAKVCIERDGMGFLHPLLEDPAVTDVLVNGSNGIWFDRGAGLELAPAIPRTETQVRSLAVRLAARAGRRLDTAAPFVDARLPGGIRLHAILPPLVRSGTHLSLRIPARQGLSLTDLQSRGTIPAPWRSVLIALWRARASFLITGGTGSGKTTLLAALLAQATETERIVIVEDCTELPVQNARVVRLEARPANVEGRGSITMTDLVRQALRMRPDRLVIGEVRGGEVRELFAALNTGHEGGCGTLHANNPADVPARLQALGSLAGLSPEAVSTQARSALQVILHLQRTQGQRRLMHVAVLDPERDGLSVLPALQADASDPTSPGTTGAGMRILERITKKC